jgi:tRNA dimethylallyltransferase
VAQTFFIVGPTASGKSELATDVALRCGAEIVSADAFQIYREMSLLTAQPNATMRRKVPHHLVDSIALREEMSAEKFRAMALGVIEEINARGKRAIVVGGSGLYVKALTHGLAPLPEADHKLRGELQSLSLDELNKRLVVADPSGAEKIDPKNKRRVVRALEICLQTKQPASAQRSQWQGGGNRASGVFVFRERGDLAARINQRVEEMFRSGVVEEVRALGEASATGAKALGLDQIRELLDGKISEAECVAAIQQATRRYAKRQLTWFRRQSTLEPLNLSLLNNHHAAVDWIVAKAVRAFAPSDD